MNLNQKQGLLHFNLWPQDSFEYRYAHGKQTLHTLLVKHCNDYLVGWGDILQTRGSFCYPLGTTYDDFQEKICMDIPYGNCQTFYCSNFTTIESFKISTRNIDADS